MTDQERARPIAGCPLTAAELQVVELLAEGFALKEIGLKLGRAHSTVRTQLHTTYKRLGVLDRAQAVIKCEREGWIGAPAATRSRCETVLGEIKLILLDCQRQLAQGTRHRVTHSQYAYLKAFDAFLRRPGAEADVAMGQALTAVLDDAHVSPGADGTRRSRSARRGTGGPSRSGRGRDDGRRRDVSDDLRHAVEHAARWTRAALDFARDDPDAHPGLIGHLTAADAQHRAVELLIEDRPVAA